ncbi:hypothetical protein CES86_5503, partial [Brucella lupini]
MSGANGGNATFTGSNIAGAPGVNVADPFSGGGGGGGAGSIFYYPTLISMAFNQNYQAQSGGFGGNINTPGDGGGGGGG